MRPLAVIRTLRRRLWMVWIVLALTLATPSLFSSQTAPAASARATKVFVTPFPDRPGAAALQADVIDRLKASPAIRIVSDAKDADAVVDGNGETWVKGYVSLSPHGGARQPVYGGYLSLAVKDRNGQPLWSYMVTPGRMHWNGIDADMTDHIVRLLTAELAQRKPAGAQPAPGPAAQIVLTGAGSTFAAPLYQQWIQAFAEQHREVQISYQPVGSEEGIRLLQTGAVDFAGSDVALTDQQMADQHANFLHFATVLGGVVPAYNLEEGAADLRFTPEILAAIYLGRITRWNSPQLRAINRGATLPDKPIVVVHRSDGSGTTFAWTDFLSATSADWKSAVGTGMKVAWPVGIAADGNESVAAAVEKTPGAIGYVELTYAIRHRLSFGLVRNAAGQFVQANLESLNAAAGSPPATGFRRSILNAPGKAAYPIATFTWILLPRDTDSKDAQKTAALRDLVRWMLTAGQKECSGLEYLPLPRELADRELTALNH